MNLCILLFKEAMDEDKTEDPCVEYVHSDTGIHG